MKSKKNFSMFLRRTFEICIINQNPTLRWRTITNWIPWNSRKISVYCLEKQKCKMMKLFYLVKSYCIRIFFCALRIVRSFLWTYMVFDQARLKTIEVLYIFSWNCSGRRLILLIIVIIIFVYMNDNSLFLLYVQYPYSSIRFTYWHYKYLLDI